MSAIKQAKFNIGQVVRHSESGRRGVVVDIDPEFSAVALGLSAEDVRRQYGDGPWYHVLLDEQDVYAYIAEGFLQGDPNPEPIEHAGLGRFFTGFDKDHYVPRGRPN